MGTVLEFVKNYFILMLILFLFTYLAPKEKYRKYFNFFISVLMVAVLMRPLLALADGDARKAAKEELMQIEEALESLEYYEEGESIVEQFLGEAKETE